MYVLQLAMANLPKIAQYSQIRGKADEICIIDMGPSKLQAIQSVCLEFRVVGFLVEATVF
jgi:hypothetical protein